LSGETRNTFDIDFLHRFNITDRHRISYGFGLHWSPNHFTAPTAVLNVLPQVETDHIHTGFVQDEIHFLDDKLLVTAGAKLQHNNFSGFDAQPTLRAVWNPNPHQSFWAAATRAVTTPSRIEEGIRIFAGEISTAPPIFLVVSGNPSFQSETLLGYEGGYRQLLTRKVYVDFDVFHNSYDHLQSFSAPTLVGNDLTIFYGNAISGTTNGIEIAPSWKPIPWWTLSFSYSYVGIDFHASQPGSDISSTGSVNTYEGSSPAHQVKIQSNIDLGKKFEFDQSYAYVSKLPAQNVRAYQTMDVRFEWKAREDLSLALAGQNLFQPYHFEWGTGDPTESLIGIRRAAYLKLTWRQ
jgi:iron complex outermembrane recepter protein